ncbi:N-acetyltransferase family protein [Macrococcus sp. EM39E]|uniref:GNAT family N-acetyltransferase n=1 Tax=Macrococcus animalis TaxID=3395467 RepID=UPI0039BDC45E
MDYRKMLPNETMQLIDFTYHALYVPPGEATYDRDIVYSSEISKYYANFDTDREICIVAEDKSQPVGAIWGRIWDKDVQGYGYFDARFVELTMSILPRHRGQGVGSELLRLFIEEVRNTKYCGISLSVSYGNYAQNLYEKACFKIVAERDTDILMVLKFE